MNRDWKNALSGFASFQYPGHYFDGLGATDHVICDLNAGHRAHTGRLGLGFELQDFSRAFIGLEKVDNDRSVLPGFGSDVGQYREVADIPP